MSQSHSCATVQNFPDFAQNLDICTYKLNSYAFSLLLHFFPFMCHIYYVNLCVIYALFLVQNFKTKVLTMQENQHLECLYIISHHLKCLLPHHHPNIEQIQSSLCMAKYQLKLIREKNSSNLSKQIYFSVFQINCTVLSICHLCTQGGSHCTVGTVNKKK